MRRNSTSIGALHPIVFFMVVYGISLVLALFVCRTVYFSINGNVAEKSNRILKNDMGYQASIQTPVLK